MKQIDLTRKNENVAVSEYLKIMPTTDIDYAEDLAFRIMRYFNAEKVCEIGYNRYSRSRYKTYAYPHTLIEYLQAYDAHRDYYMLDLDEQFLMSQRCDVVEQKLIDLMHRLNEVANKKQQVICVDHLYRLLDDFGINFENIVDATQKDRNIRFLWFDETYHLESYKIRKRRIYKLPRPLQRDIREYVAQLAKDENIYDKIKNPKRYFGIIATQGEITYRGNAFDNSRKLFYKILDTAKKQDIDINDLDTLLCRYEL